MKLRLDKSLVERGHFSNRSQAENAIRLGWVYINGQVATKSGIMVDGKDRLVVATKNRYVSRAGLKLASVARDFALDFRNKTVLDIGSSTGGFTDYALQHGAQKVYAVDVGTNQLHSSLRGSERIELHEKTDIRDFLTDQPIDIIVADVSFISLREVLPHVAQFLMQPATILAVMVKPQFEAGRGQVYKGVIKNDRIRRQILDNFETWAKRYFVILDKKDSSIAGAKGNVERFYKLSLANDRYYHPKVQTRGDVIRDS